MTDQTETEMNQGRKRWNLAWIVPAALFVMGMMTAWIFTIGLALMWLGRAGWHSIFG